MSWDLGIPADEADPGIDVLVGLYPSVDRLRSRMGWLRRAYHLLHRDRAIALAAIEQLHADCLNASEEIAYLGDTNERMRATARLSDQQAQQRIRELEDNYAAVSKRLDEWRAMADAQRERADRLDERRHEIHELLRHRETENERLRAVAEAARSVRHDPQCARIEHRAGCTCGWRTLRYKLDQIGETT